MANVLYQIESRDNRVIWRGKYESAARVIRSQRTKTNPEGAPYRIVKIDDDYIDNQT